MLDMGSTTAFTLLDLLQQENPDLSEAGPSSSRRTKNGSISSTRSTRHESYPVPSKVLKWDDFNINTMNKIFGQRLWDVLNQEVQLTADYTKIHPAFLEVSSEDALTSLIIKSNQSVVLHALNESAQGIVQQDVRMVRGSQAVMAFAKSKKFVPDWAGTSNVQAHKLPLGDKTEHFNILPGDTKPSWVMDFQTVEERLDSERNLPWTEANSIWPLRQIIFYCVSSFARYGYIITDKELVVVQVGVSRSCKIPEEDYLQLKKRVLNDLLVHYVSIPWKTSHQKSTGLTVNLALWFLHILAANNGKLQCEPYGSLLDEALKLPGQHRRFPVVRILSEGTDPPRASGKSSDSIFASPEASSSSEGTAEFDLSEEDEDQIYYSANPSRNTSFVTTNSDHRTTRARRHSQQSRSSRQSNRLKRKLGERLSDSRNRATLEQTRKKGKGKNPAKITKGHHKGDRVSRGL